MYYNFQKLQFTETELEFFFEHCVIHLSCFKFYLFEIHYILTNYVISKGPDLPDYDFYKQVDESMTVLGLLGNATFVLAKWGYICYMCTLLG